MTMQPLSPAPLFTAPVIPVVTIARAEDAVPLARALLAGGLPAIEVTLRTPAALDAVRAIVAQVPEVIAGVGTVTSEYDIRRAVDADAAFMVTPGTPAALAAALADAPVPAMPGCATVAEALALVAHGFRVLKFFPAEASGGVTWLRSVAAPLADVRFCPTGGIAAGNAASYLALPNVVAVGGSWVAPMEAIAAGEFDRIATLAREASALGR
jgi:2-dehydro-3-deoxyphosphogluconate aldolase/(4S)-4-hydroxy-2-oxoglutarate aldolase